QVAGHRFSPPFNWLSRILYRPDRRRDIGLAEETCRKKAPGAVRARRGPAGPRMRLTRSSQCSALVSYAGRKPTPRVTERARPPRAGVADTRARGCMTHPH